AAAFVDSSTSTLAVSPLLCNPVQLPSPLWRRLVPAVGVALFDPAAELARVLVRAEMGADLFVPGKDVGARRRQRQHHRAATIGAEIFEQPPALVASPGFGVARAGPALASVRVDPERPAAVLAAAPGAVLDPRTIRPSDRALA